MANTTANVTVKWLPGQSILYAGTPLDQYGGIANNSNAYGILAEDLHMPDKTAVVINAGDWDEEISRSNGIALTDEAKNKLSSISFTGGTPEYVTPGSLSKTLSGYVLKTDAATTEAAGIVKMAEAVGDSEEETSPTTAEFNALLGTLRTAGILDTEEQDP